MSRKPRRTPAEAEHHEWVRRQPCAVCGSCDGVEAHHVGHPMGGHKLHWWVCPLCEFHHRGFKGIHNPKVGKRRWEADTRTTETALVIATLAKRIEEGEQ